MSRPKKPLYFAVMIVGGVALFVDRCVLSDDAATLRKTPASARADSPAPLAPPDENLETTLSIPELPFPRGLKPFDPATDMRDLFAPLPQDTDGDLNSSAPDKDRPLSAGGPGPLNSETFVAQHHLDGVMNDQRLKIAIVDGRWVRPGEKIDGCTLTKLEGTRVSFECSDGEAVLQLSTRRLLSPD